MQAREFPTAERYPVKCYKLNGITYVPHCTMTGYAYPSIGAEDLPISEAKLKAAGAERVIEMMYAFIGRKEK